MPDATLLLTIAVLLVIIVLLTFWGVYWWGLVHDWDGDDDAGS